MLRKSREGGKEFDLSNAETDIPEETGSDHGHNFVDKEDEQNFAEEAPPAARRDEPGPMTLFITATASRRGPTGGLGAAAPVRAASEARAPADNLPTERLIRVEVHSHALNLDPGSLPRGRRRRRRAKLASLVPRPLPERQVLAT